VDGSALHERQADNRGQDATHQPGHKLSRTEESGTDRRDHVDVSTNHGANDEQSEIRQVQVPARADFTWTTRRATAHAGDGMSVSGWGFKQRRAASGRRD